MKTENVVPLSDRRGQKPAPDADDDPVTSAATLAALEIEDIRERFPSDTRHSFRTPLTIIDSAARRLVRQAGRMSEDEIVQKATMIRSTVGGMVELLERLISHSELTSTKPVAVQEVLFVDLITALCNEYEAADPEASIEVFDAGAPAITVTDPKLVELILDKLMSIGASAVQKHGRGEVTWWEDEGTLVISLKAIHKANGTSAAQSLTRKLEGAFDAKGHVLDQGMDFRLTRLIVEMHRGEIDYEVESDRVVLELRLPVSHQSDGTRCLLRAGHPKKNPIRTAEGGQI